MCLKMSRDIYDTLGDEMTRMVMVVKNVCLFYTMSTFRGLNRTAICADIDSNCGINCIVIQTMGLIYYWSIEAIHLAKCIFTLSS